MRVLSRELSDADYEAFVGYARQLAGIHLGPGKRHLVVSRLIRRVRALGLSGLDEYRRYLADRLVDEQENFVNAITTNLTYFFRERHHFDYLATWAKAHPGTDIRVWSAGCATGQEPYSIAMTLHNLGIANRCRILATDIDTHCLEQARVGVYPLADLKDLSLQEKRCHFLNGVNANAGLVRAKEHLRKLIEFERLNLMEDWPERGKFHVVFCRNVFIYFDPATQVALLERFARCIHSDGVLFLGHSELLQPPGELFSLVGRTTYRRCHS